MIQPLKLTFLLVLLVACVVIGIHGLGDLPMYYSISQFAGAHEWSKIYGHNPGVGRFFYGPLSLVLFYPFHFFEYGTVKAFWLVLNTVSFVAFWWGLSRLYPVLAEKRFSLAWLFVWIFSIKSIHSSFQSLNVQLLFITAFIFSELLRKTKKPSAQWVAGVLPALAAMLKLYPLFLCAYYLIVGGRWVRAGLLSGVALSFALPALLFGPTVTAGLVSDFFGNLGSFHDVAPLTRDAVTLSLPSLIATYLSPIAGMDVSIRVIQGVVLTLSGTFFFFIFVLNRQSDPERNSVHAWALSLAWMALLNSTTRPDYFVYFIPALCSLIELGKAARSGFLYWAGVFCGVGLIAFIADWILGSRDLNHQLELLRLPVLGMILLCGLLFSKVRNLPAFTR